MKIISIQPGSREWLEYRRGGIGGSDIATCMGAKSFKTRKQLFLDKSALSDEYVNDFMRRGTLYEGEALLNFCIDFRCNVKPICIESEENHIWRASLDGYGEVKGQKAVVEIKVPTSQKVGIDAQAGIIPENYIMQIQWQMMIGEAEIGYFVVYDPDTQQSVVVQVEPNLELQQQLKEAANEFWDYFLKGEIMPDSLQVIEDTKLETLIKEASRLKEEMDALKKQLEPLEEEIKSYATDDGFRAYGYTCRFTNGRTTYDYKKMAAEGVDIDKYSKTGKPFYTLKKEK